MKYLSGFFLFLILMPAYAQENNNSSSADSVEIPLELRKQAYIYSLAKKYNDPAVARMALYNLIAVNPSSSAILDSLALLYFDYQQYASAAIVAQDALSLNPDDLFASEVAAIAFDNLGVKSRAVTHYEKLYLASNDLETLYKIAFLQYELKRYSEALNNTDIITASPKSEEIKLLFPLNNQQNQEISLKASTLRLKGMIEAAQGNTEQARTYFQQALELAPEFSLVKEQLKALDEQK